MLRDIEGALLTYTHCGDRRVHPDHYHRDYESPLPDKSSGIWYGVSLCEPNPHEGMFHCLGTTEEERAALVLLGTGGYTKLRRNQSSKAGLLDSPVLSNVDKVVMATYDRITS